MATASRYSRQSLERLRSLPALSIAKFPCWNWLYAGIDAEFCFITRAWTPHSTYECIEKNAPKIPSDGAMRTPYAHYILALLGR